MPCIVYVDQFGVFEVFLCIVLTGTMVESLPGINQQSWAVDLFPKPGHIFEGQAVGSPRVGIVVEFPAVCSIFISIAAVN